MLKSYADEKGQTVTMAIERILQEFFNAHKFMTDENGKTVPVSGTEKLYPCTGVIIAISQGAESNLVTTTKGIDTVRSGLLTVDEDGHTSRPGVFAAGDAASGARTVVEAVANSKRVAEAMHEYMQSLPLPVLTDYPDAPRVETMDVNAQAEQLLP